ncbi:unnamed protein product [Amoebophrya sp. A25]|nr:unnamed protein product [Amoebophrya sp. A25]|eukprot:GSA25T00023815001.1
MVPHLIHGRQERPYLNNLAGEQGTDRRHPPQHLRPEQERTTERRTSSQEPRRSFSNEEHFPNGSRHEDLFQITVDFPDISLDTPRFPGDEYCPGDETITMLNDCSRGDYMLDPAALGRPPPGLFDDEEDFQDPYDVSSAGLSSAHDQHVFPFSRSGGHDNSNTSAGGSLHQHHATFSRSSESSHQESDSSSSGAAPSSVASMPPSSSSTIQESCASPINNNNNNNNNTGEHSSGSGNGTCCSDINIPQSSSRLLLYLHAAGDCIREVEASKLKSSASNFGSKVEVAKSLTDLQQGLRDRVSTETTRDRFADTWGKLARFREDVEASGARRELVAKISSAQLYLQHFQEKLSDVLTVDAALAALQELETIATETRWSAVRDRVNLTLDTVSSTTDWERTTSCIAIVKDLREEVLSSPSATIERMQTKFEAAFDAVKALRESAYNYAGGDQEGDAKNNFLVGGVFAEKSGAAFNYLVKFQQRLNSLHALDRAVLALKDMADIVQSVRAEGNGRERFLMGLEFSRQKVKGLQNELNNLRDMSRLRGFYEHALEAVRQLEHTQMVKTQLRGSEQAFLRQKIAEAFASIESVVKESRQSLDEHVSRVTLNQARAALFRVGAQIPDFPRERLQQVLSLLETTLQSAIPKGKVQDIYQGVMEALEGLRSELIALSSFGVRYRVAIDQLREVTGSLQNQLLSACVHATVNTCAYAERRFPGTVERGCNLLHRSWSSIKAVDDERFGSGVQSRIKEAAAKLDARFLNGKGHATMHRVWEDYSEAACVKMNMEEEQVKEQTSSSYSHPGSMIEDDLHGSILSYPPNEAKRMPSNRKTNKTRNVEGALFPCRLSYF